MARTPYSKDSHGRDLDQVNEGIKGAELGVPDLQADRCFDVGIDDFISKPIQIDELRS